MRTFHIFHIFLFLVSLFNNPCNGQENISVRQLPILDQLPSNSVYRVFQDKEGYMWFGTQDGLCRYDGYQMKIFRSDLNNPHLLTSNDIKSIAEDAKGNLWIGTNEGLNILKKGTFTFISHPDSTLRNKYISSIVTASDSTIWVGYYNGVKRYNTDFGLIEDYSYKENNPKSIPYASVNNIYEDSYQNIWILLWDKGLYKYNKESKLFTKSPKIGKLDNPFNMFQDKKNNYWIGTWNDGLHLFTSNKISENSFTDLESSSRIENNNAQTFFSFTQDDYNHYIWAMSMSGLSTYKYDKRGNIFSINTHDLFKNTNNIFSEIIKDRNGNLWIGAFSEGVFMISFNKPVIQNFPTNIFNNKYNIAPSFTSLCDDNNGNIWINQNRLGLFIYSPEKQNLKYYKEIDKLKDKDELTKISYVTYISSLHEIWITNQQNSKICKIGLQKNKNLNSDIKYTKDYDLSSISKSPGTTQAIFEDNNSNIWVATSDALFVQPAEAKNMYTIKNTPGSITAISQDVNNNIWISTSNNGIYKLATPKYLTQEQIQKIQFRKITQNSLSDHIPSIAADLSGQIWIGTKEGSIYAYNTTDKTFSNKTSDCGLAGEAILDLIVDKYNNVWITTYKKIIEFNPKNNAHYIYSHSDGIQINSHLKGAFFKPQNSTSIYIAGNRGYSRFTPSEFLLAPPKKSQVQITDIKVQSESILFPHKKNKLDSTKNILRLAPDDKNIEIYFSTLNYNNPEKIRFAYKLVGVDNDWNYINNDRHFALYNQLKKGKYTFQVKATDEHNLWSNEITSLRIIKEPHYYETHLAYALYVILIVIVIYIIIYIILNRVKLRSQITMAQFEKNKSEELTQTKLKYFTNISHDLLTPLTIISCLIDDIETTSKKNKNQLSIMRSNIERLKRLLQQILDFRRIEGGKMQLHISQSDIVAFIKDICYNHFFPLFNTKKIDLEFNCSPNEINAYFDADKIDKVVFNILSNAFKFTSEGGKIHINLALKKQNNTPFIDIFIEDTGIGIDPKDLDKIFTRFYTNKNLNSSDTHGIGLSLCKDLIELHHGTITVESKLQKGTTFTVTIPIDKNSYTDNEIITESVLGLSDTESIELNTCITNDENDTTNKTNINILLVEDNLELLHLMRQILSRSYNILTSTNGKKALEIINKTDIPIVISDVMMPDMDGIELCKTLKNNIETSHISIILLTAKNSINDRVECYNAGADAYISKPFEMNVLLARINNFISTKQSKQKEFKSNVEINVSALEYPSMDEQFLKNAITIIENNLSETDFDVNTFAEELNISKSSLYRKIKTTTDLSPVEFIKNIKLKHASLMLKKDTSISISEVAYAVGFSDPKYFSSCFKAEFNITPREFQKTTSNEKIAHKNNPVG